MNTARHYRFRAERSDVPESWESAGGTGFRASLVLARLANLAAQQSCHPGKLSVLMERTQLGDGTQTLLAGGL